MVYSALMCYVILFVLLFCEVLLCPLLWCCLFRCVQPDAVFFAVLLLGVLCFSVLVPVVCSYMRVYSAVLCAVFLIMLWDDNCVIRYKFVHFL